MLENFTGPFNATPYERLKSSGAILIGKTNLDEFAMGSGTIDSKFGATKNVWTSIAAARDDDWNVAGGSSGGSAVAVAAGLCYGWVHFKQMCSL